MWHRKCSSKATVLMMFSTFPGMIKMYELGINLQNLCQSFHKIPFY